MEGSEHRIYKLIRTAVPTLALAGVVAVAGCGGGGGTDSGSPPAPVKQAGATVSGVVSADGTQGLVGPVGRATASSQQFEDKLGRISPKANRKTDAQKHGVAAGAGCDNSDVTPSDADLDLLNSAILCLVNGERADAGLPALNENPQLDQAATGMAQRMVNEHFFSHDTPDGKNIVDRIEPTGYIPDSSDWVVGENLAWGSGALSTPQAIVNGWMNSPGHRANILAPDYKDIGLAATMGAPSPDLTGGTVYVNNFGAKSGADLNARLPTESGSTGTAAAASTVAGAKVAKKASAKAKHKRRHKRHKRHHKQSRSHKHRAQH
ncbi:MAG TPA: CAP domain-containing protein [Thermoleophilaceae bacterium]|jgi:uncharacterized protein YkwD|nr:CAP domain-containing protein [Thermoleophilaceae bacterium]